MLKFQLTELASEHDTLILKHDDMTSCNLQYNVQLQFTHNVSMNLSYSNAFNRIVSDECLSLLLLPQFISQFTVHSSNEELNLSGFLISRWFICAFLFFQRVLGWQAFLFLFCGLIIISCHFIFKMIPIISCTVIPIRHKCNKHSLWSHDFHPDSLFPYVFLSLSVLKTYSIPMTKSTPTTLQATPAIHVVMRPYSSSYTICWNFKPQLQSAMLSFKIYD